MRPDIGKGGRTPIMRVDLVDGKKIRGADLIFSRRSVSARVPLRHGRRRLKGKRIGWREIQKILAQSPYCTFSSLFNSWPILHDVNIISPIFW